MKNISIYSSFVSYQTCMLLFFITKNKKNKDVLNTSNNNMSPALYSKSLMHMIFITVYVLLSAH